MIKKYILLLILSLATLAGYSQETPPSVGANFKLLSTSQFYIQLPDSAIWQYKGAVYGWERLGRYKDVRLTNARVDSLVTNLNTIHVWLIAGQSNAQGSSQDSINAPLVPNGVAYQYYLGGIKRVYKNVGSGNGGAWPAFANTYNGITNNKLLFVPTALGSTSQTAAANSGAGTWDTTGTLYNNSLIAVANAMAAASAAGYNPIFKGVLWCQGETDAGAIFAGTITKTTYALAFAKMIRNYRAALGQNIQFNIFRTGGDTFNTGFRAIRAMQDSISVATPNTPIVFRNAATFFDRGLMRIDGLHYTQAGYNEMGEDGAAKILAPDRLTQVVSQYDKLGIGIKDPAHALDIAGDKVISINGTRTVYLPDQAAFSTSMVFGTAGTNWIHTSATQESQGNTFVGYQAGRLTKRATNMTIMGAQSAFTDTASANLTGIGYRNSYNMINSQGHTSLGAFASYNATAIDYGMFSGFYSGFTMGTGSYVTSSGAFALRYALTGLKTVAFGDNALLNSLNPQYNSAFGSEAGSNSQGRYNLYLGYRAGANHTGSDGIFIGPNTGGSDTTSNRFYLGGRQGAFMFGDMLNKTTGLNGAITVNEGINASATMFAGQIPKLAVNTGGGGSSDYEDLVVFRHTSPTSGTNLKRIGIIAKLSNETSAGESAKMGGFTVESSGGFANTPDMYLVTANKKQVKIGYDGSLGVGVTQNSNLYVYNNFTDASNNESLTIKPVSNVMTVISEKLGTGTLRPLSIGTTNRRLVIDDLGTTTTGFYNFSAGTSSANIPYAVINGNITATSGTTDALRLSNTINQSSSGGYNMLNINPTETATGSGIKNLVRAAVGSTERMTLNNVGDFSLGGVTGVNYSGSTKIFNIGTQPLAAASTLGLFWESNGNLSGAQVYKKSEVDALLATYLPLAGGTLSGGLIGTTANFATSLQTPVIGIGSAPSATVGVNHTSNITGGVTAAAYQTTATAQSGVTTQAAGFKTTLSTQATSFTLTDLVHFNATQGTIGAGSTVTNQYGFMASSSLSGGTNTYGFHSNITAGGNKWNFYAQSTAKNFFNGSVLIGSSTDNGQKLQVTGRVRVSQGLAGTPGTDSVLVHDNTSKEMKLIDPNYYASTTSLNSSLSLKADKTGNNAFVGSNTFARNVNDATDVMTIDQQNTSASGKILKLKYNGSDKFTFNPGGSLVMSDGLEATNYINVVSGSSKANLSPGQLAFDNGTYIGFLTRPTLTASRTWRLPDSTGTLALAGNIPITSSGTYTPTLSAGTNVASVTARLCHYTRVGSQVTVMGFLDCTPTTVGGGVVYISLPVASNLGADEDLSGQCVPTITTGSPGTINAYSTGDQALLQFTATASTPGSIRFSFMYTVIP